MRRMIRLYWSLPTVHRANGTAVALALVTLIGLRLEFDPSIAGADYRQIVVKKSQPLKMSFAKATPEVKNDITPEISPDTSADVSAEVAMATATTADSIVRSSIENPVPVTAETPAAANLRRKVSMLREGLAFLQQTPDYTAQFTKQELVAGELTEEQSIYVKIRHQPFSIYLKWLTGDAGREVLYVAGENADKMIVHAGGWKARLPAISIEPESSLAMAESRYPVTKAGMLELTKLMLHYHTLDLQAANFATCDVLEGESFGDRPCTAFQVEYRSKEVSPDYRKTITIIDNEWKVPVCIRNFSWPSNSAADAETVDEETLLEAYSYTEISFGQQLAEADFDSKNEEYRFRRQ
ncbi:hypothetical protein Spb1_38780 [Planctopirus ephydatiae]|jgi:hypothetical protein|uniref:DUF1571 domain-containing protein n=1 Tax=Planctopirus ephydatiae TaxID=2528019 RepID=A0A518GTL2_9PLAN|nr:DUF1571 domain-containing protein [Planctopirus ephydatiae]QDV31931.1 hypothetical protein Spb1_38780 [Planctopirus ephydatiae]